MRPRATSRRAVGRRATIGIILLCALVASARAFDDAWLDEAEDVDEPRGSAFESSDRLEVLPDAREEIGYEEAFDVNEDVLVRSFDGRKDAAIVEEAEMDDSVDTADARGDDANAPASVDGLAREGAAAVESEVVVVDASEAEDASEPSRVVEEESIALGDSVKAEALEVVAEMADEEGFFENWGAPSPMPPDFEADGSEPSEDLPTTESRSLEAVEPEDDDEHDEVARPGFLRGLLSQFGAKLDSSDDSVDVVIEPAGMEESMEDASEAVLAETDVESVDVVETALEVTPEPEAEPVIVPEAVPAQVDKVPEPVPKPVEASEEHNDRRRLLQAQQSQQAHQEPPPAKAEIVYVGGYYKRANPWAKGPRVRAVD